MATVKKLKMVFETEEAKSYTLSIPDPKDGLALADAKAAAADIMPAFETSGGVGLASFTSAAVETVSTEALA